MAPHNLGDSVVISIYWLDAYDLKNKWKCACDKAIKKCFAFEYEFSFTLTWSFLAGSLLTYKQVYVL